MTDGTSEAILVYNTLSRKLELLTPLKPGKISMYVCGPTVYDDPHIGHLRSAYVFDVILRILRRHFEVRFVRNVTDVDDKIIDRAKQDGSDWKEVSVKYLAAYHEALSKMGTGAPDAEPKATEHIAEMIAMIRKLVDEKKAYSVAGSVYFRVRAQGSYGRLSNQKIDEILDNQRVEAEEGKEDVLDFALWKASKPGEPSWPAPWGAGRPGWHIECSAMTLETLGVEFDIHGGGRDLLFPHHENERAQSVAATGKNFAKLWIHHGLLTIEGRKMSKSLGNFVTLEEILKRGYSIDALKLLFLQSHYRSDVDFTWEKMQALETAIKRFHVFFEKAGEGTPSAEDFPGGVDAYEKKFQEALRNDFDTPAAVAALFEMLNAGNAAAVAWKAPHAAFARAWILEKAALFGLFGRSVLGGEAEWKSLLDQIIRFRNQKRANREYKVSDFLRVELARLGVELEDGRKGTLAVPVHSVDGEKLKKMNEIFEQAKKI